MRLLASFTIALSLPVMCGDELNIGDSRQLDFTAVLATESPEVTPADVAVEEHSIQPVTMVTSSLKINPTSTPAGPAWWSNFTAATGYVKLITPIIHNESNMFSIKIIGYGYAYNFDPIEIRCGGYAYGGGTLINTDCHTEGTDLPVAIDTEERGVSRVVVIRIGTPTSSWYYPHFTAEYVGWSAKAPDSFQWVIGETTPPAGGNMNNVFVNDAAGTMTTTGSVGIGTTNPPSGSGLTVHNPGGQTLRLRDTGDVTHYRTQQVIYAATADTAGLYVGVSQDAVPSPVSYFTNGAAFVINGKNAPLYLGTNNSPKVTIDSAGNVGIGMFPSPTIKLDVAGNANFSGTVTGGNIQAKYQDVAEWVPSADDLSPGTVVVLNPAKSNEVRASTSAYDTTVAGVVSAAPGLILGERSEDKEMIATTGRVKVRVDATRLPIRVGDLLVTSDHTGLAMRSEPIDIAGISIHRPGTIIGKALEPLESGEGEILVLLSLQ